MGSEWGGGVDGEEGWSLGGGWEGGRGRWGGGVGGGGGGKGVMADCGGRVMKYVIVREV